MSQSTTQVFLPGTVNSFYGADVTVSFSSSEIKVSDNTGNASQLAAGDTLTLEIKDFQGETTYQTITINVSS
ncbi:MAG: hypothetical protein AAF657_17270 [Acidobacteriota bacterium]